ncbi:MAG TPA: threonine/serine dehydratase [Pseudonocardiaceae bacterium]
MLDLIGLPDVLGAAARIRPWAVHTSLLRSPELDALLGLTLVIKAEHHQRTGSFKLRGALNRMLRLDTRERAAGVIAGSSGNHGRALAAAASLVGTTATVVMPADAPAGKLDAIRTHGAHVVTVDRLRTDRDTLTTRLAIEQGRLVVPSSDDPDVIAGAGTVALELLAEAGRLDALIVPVGGGGLAAGCAVAAAALRPGLRVYGVEPAGADDTRRSVLHGQVCTIAPPATIADGLRHRRPGRLTFPITSRLLHDILVVSDRSIADAMRLCEEHLHERIEPSAACSLAAVLSRPALFRDRHVAVVATGGNIEPTLFDHLVSTTGTAGMNGTEPAPASRRTT